MTTAYQHRPLSKILAQPAGEKDEAPTPEQPRNEKGQFEAASEPAPKEESTLPEKYQGKSVEEVVEMHQNSERRLGQIQNEVGQLRGLVQDLAVVQRTSQPATVEPQEVDLSGDDLLRDPVSAIQKVVQATQPPPQEDTQTQATLDEVDVTVETGALYTDFPDLDQTIMTPEFQEFASRTPSRTADARIAADPSSGVEAVRAARRLLENYQDFTQERPAPEPSKDPVEEAKKVANEPNHPAAVVPQDAIYESDVITMINSDPEKYRSPSFQAQLTAAIREGRYIKQS
jgi:hypothetical protein